ncbi:hypothetical protein [Aquabacter spiritensis]|nr:hypothetical protein [Aquabacter spiritensis]
MRGLAIAGVVTAAMMLPGAAMAQGAPWASGCQLSNGRIVCENYGGINAPAGCQFGSRLLCTMSACAFTALFDVRDKSIVCRR